MIPSFPPALTIFLLVMCGLLAMAAGALAGMVTSFFLRLPIQAVLRDALIGLFGFFVFFVTVLVSRLGYLLINNHIDPAGVGFLVAALCAVVREVLRFKNIRSHRTTSRA